MNRLHCDLVLLPSGWHSDMTIVVNEQGDIHALEPGRAGPSDQRLKGAVLPGVPNLHSHAHQRAMAGLAEHSGSGPDSFWTWREVMYNCVQRLGPEDLQAVAAQLYLEMLKAGYTAVAEFHYLHHDPQGQPYAQRAEMGLRTLAAARDVGIGITSLPVFYACGGFGGQLPGPGQRRFINDVQGVLRILESLQEQSAGDANVGLAPHSLRAVTPALLEEALSGLRQLQPEAPIHIHIAEQQKEVDDCLSWSGQRPVEWLLEHIDVGPRWCLIHATHMQTAETRALAASGAVAGLCPTTEANLGDGLFPAVDYLAAGGRLGIGSDSHCSVSPVEELRWLEYGQRLKHRGRNLLAGGPNRSTGRNLLELAWAGGAQACGRRLGAIAPGYRADLIELDREHPLLAGRSEDALLDSWLFSGNNSLLRTVIVGGRSVVRDGHHEQEETIARTYRTVLQRLYEDR